MKYPYRYEKVAGGVRIHASPEVSTQMLKISHELYGVDLLNGIIFTGHWYLQIRKMNHSESMNEAKKVTKIWRSRHNNALLPTVGPARF